MNLEQFITGHLLGLALGAFGFLVGVWISRR